MTAYWILKQGRVLLATLRVVITHSGEIVNNRNFNANHLARLKWFSCCLIFASFAHPI